MNVDIQIILVYFWPCTINPDWEH